MGRSAVLTCMLIKTIVFRCIDKKISLLYDVAVIQWIMSCH